MQNLTQTKLICETSKGQKTHLTVNIESLSEIGNQKKLNKDRENRENQESSDKELGLEAPKNNSVLKLDSEKMDYILSFYHSIINSPDLTLESITEEKLRDFYLNLVETKKTVTRELGKKLLRDFLEYSEDEITPEWAYLVGKTRYFFSYSQNLLEHLLEVSILSANFAFQLGLNVQKVKRAAFFHDIGKIVGQHSNHVLEGLKLGKDYKLEEYILETIEKHHNYEQTSENVYLTIVRAMDKLSAGRLGARPLQIEKTKERNDKLCATLLEISEISRLEFLAGGHIIKIFLEPKLFEWKKLENLKKEIADKVKSATLKYQYNYQFLIKLEYSDSFLLEEFL